MASTGSVPIESLSPSPKARAIISGIQDSTLRGQVDDAIRHGLVALRELSRVHLPQDNFEAGGDSASIASEHITTAPYVLAAVAAINRLLAYLVDTFPAPPESSSNGRAAGFDLGGDASGGSGDGFDDFDLEFDSVDGEGGGGLSSRAQDSTTMTPEQEVADVAYAYGGMLRARVVSFGERLRTATQGGDSWMILGELDDSKHRMTKAVQALVFGILGIFNNGASREEILPEYRSAVGESIALRTSVTELSFQIGRSNASLSAGGESGIAVPLMVAVADQLARFSSQPIYRTLRAEDKKAVIDFRRELYQLRHGQGKLNLTRLRYAVEGFSKFLESLQAINHREVLVLHDQALVGEVMIELNQLLASLGRLDPRTTRARLDALVSRLDALTGRNPGLDDLLRTYEPGSPRPPQPAELQALLGALQQTAAMCG